MKFNYDLYRPKKIIQDAWKSNSNYFRSKDVNITPLTKIGDADEVHKSQSAGRIPALAKKLKPNRLALDVTLARGKKIFVRSAALQKRVEVPMDTPPSTFTKQSDASPAKRQPAWRFNAHGGAFLKKPVINTRRDLLAWSNPALKYFLLAIVVIGVGAGSVRAYTSLNTAQPEVLGQSSKHATGQEENPNPQKESGEAPSTTPEPPAPSAPAAQAVPQRSSPTTNATSDNQPSPSSNPQEIANSNTKDLAAAPPVAVTPPPSTPVNVPDPSPDPTSPPQPTTPPSNEAGTPQVPNESEQETDTDTSIDEPIAPPAPPTPGNSSSPDKEHTSSTKGSTKQ